MQTAVSSLDPWALPVPTGQEEACTVGGHHVREHSQRQRAPVVGLPHGPGQASSHLSHEKPRPQGLAGGISEGSLGGVWAISRPRDLPWALGSLAIGFRAKEMLTRPVFSQRSGKWVIGQAPRSSFGRVPVFLFNKKCLKT